MTTVAETENNAPAAAPATAPAVSVDLAAQTPAPVTTATTEPGNTPPATTVAPNAEAGNNTTGDPNFVLPEAFKDDPALKKFNSLEGLMKSYKELETKIGEKNLPPDLNTATEQEREAFYAKMRPAAATDYSFGEESEPAIVGPMSDSFYRNGVSKAQGDAIISDYNKLETELYNQTNGQPGWEAEMKKSFGDNYQEKTAAVLETMKDFLAVDDQKVVSEKLPNAYLGVMTRFADKLFQAYGVKEKAPNLKGNPSEVPKVDMTTKRAELREQHSKLKANPYHDPAELEAIQNELNDTYKQGK